MELAILPPHHSVPMTGVHHGSQTFDCTASMSTLLKFYESWSVNSSKNLWFLLVPVHPFLHKSGDGSLFFRSGFCGQL